MLSRFASAFRHTRNYVGGFTGLTFVIGFFKVPLINFLGGWGPLIFISSLGTTMTGVKFMKNSELAKENKHLDEFRQNKVRSSIVFIASKLVSDTEKTKHFLKNYQITPESKDQEYTYTQLEKILQEKFKTTQNEKQKDASNIMKYSYCTGISLIQFSSHFMECLLAKGYGNPDLFNFDEFTTDNILAYFNSSTRIIQCISIF